ncbi:MAG: M56 family metallopeptidase, partial [Solirubrobacteraceae bacterium]
VYCCLCALGLSLAAIAAERALIGGRGPVRVVWIGAVALSLAIPAIAFRAPTRSAPLTVVQPVVATVAAGPAFDSVVAAPAPVVESAVVPAPRFDWRDALARLDQPLIAAWVALSLFVAFNFLGGVVALAWLRRRWEKHVVLDVPVLVSDRTGPAVVGVLSPAIVIPRWMLALSSAKLDLMLRHEQEHRRAGDGRLLAAAQMALIVMPWNAALWWQMLRLRVAVELDCDARVLQNADARSYGDLLLEVARPRRSLGMLGATAFAERATQLERRIRVLSRHRERTSAAARLGAAVVGLVAVTAAWAAPRPAVPTRVEVPTLVSPTVESTRAPAVPVPPVVSAN